MKKFARFLLIFVGALIAIVVIMAVVGLFLPRRHQVTVSQSFAAAPDTVWQVLTDVSAYPKWRRDITRIEILPSDTGRIMWREYDKWNQNLYYSTTVVNPPTRLTIEIIHSEASNPAFGGRWEIEILPESGGSRVSITEDGWVDNPIFRFIMSIFFGKDATVKDYLNALEKRLAATAAG